MVWNWGGFKLVRNYTGRAWNWCGFPMGGAIGMGGDIRWKIGGGVWINLLGINPGKRRFLAFLIPPDPPQISV